MNERKTAWVVTTRYSDGSSGEKVYTDHEAMCKALTLAIRPQVPTRTSDGHRTVTIQTREWAA